MKDSFCKNYRSIVATSYSVCLSFVRGASHNFAFSLQNPSHKLVTGSTVMEPGNGTLINHDADTDINQSHGFRLLLNMKQVSRISLPRDPCNSERISLNCFNA